MRKTGARVIPTSSTRTTAPPASRRAAQPRLVLATRAASVVASGTQTSPSAYLPRTRSGPTTPIGIWATPMKFSQLRWEARWTSSEWWPMLGSGVLRHLLQGLAADLGRLLGGQVLGQLMEAALARDQRADELLAGERGRRTRIGIGDLAHLTTL